MTNEERIAVGILIEQLDDVLNDEIRQRSINIIRNTQLYLRTKLDESFRIEQTVNKQ